MDNNIPESAIEAYNEMEDMEVLNQKTNELWYCMSDDEKIEFVEDIWGQGTIGEIVVNDVSLTSTFLSHIQFNDNLWERVFSALKEKYDG